MWHGIHGHDAVAEQFRRSLAGGRLGSSFLLLGPAGVGKRTFALKLAQALLCTEGDATQLDPCGGCESCRLAGVGNHPDIDLVGLREGKRWLAIDQFIGDRDHRNQVGLCHNISLRPMMGSRRVAIIDDADYLTTESANCLLKTLEEPPSGAMLMLIGTSRGRQLPTILSRTQTVRFSPLPEESVRQLLVELGIVAEETEAATLAAACGGSLQRAVELADAQLGEMEDQLLLKLTAPRFDSVRLAAELAVFVNQAGKEAAARRQRLRAIFHAVGGHFQQMLRASCGVVGEGAALGRGPRIGRRAALRSGDLPDRDRRSRPNLGGRNRTRSQRQPGSAARVLVRRPRPIDDRLEETGSAVRYLSRLSCGFSVHRTTWLS